MDKYNLVKPIEILLVEDNPGDARLVREAFKNSKMLNNIYTVEDGVEAMAYLRKTDKYAQVTRPDLILLDLNLPKKDGREVLKEVKEDKDLRRIPVVILTTSDLEKDIIGAYDQYTNCYITKPVDFKQFLAVVSDIENFWLAVVKLPEK